MRTRRGCASRRGVMTMGRGPNKNVCAQCGARVDEVVWQSQAPGVVWWCWRCHRAPDTEARPTEGDSVSAAREGKGEGYGVAS
jgi:hypothetical protein